MDPEIRNYEQKAREFIRDSIVGKDTRNFDYAFCDGPACFNKFDPRDGIIDWQKDKIYCSEECRDDDQDPDEDLDARYEEAGITGPDYYEAMLDSEYLDHDYYDEEGNPL